MDEFGKNLRFYRKQRRQTQTELANRVGVAPAYVSQIESALRMPSLKVARRFAEALNVELPVLLGTPEANEGQGREEVGVENRAKKYPIRHMLAGVFDL